MTTGLKVGIGVGLLAALAAWGVSAAKKVAANFTFDLVGFGKPTLKNFMLTVPTQVRFNNPTSLAINLDNITVDLYVLKNSTFVKAARISQSLTIPAGVSVQPLYPEINIKNLFGGDIMDTILAASNALTTKFITVKAEVRITYNGVNLPTQFIPQQDLYFA